MIAFIIRDFLFFYKRQCFCFACGSDVEIIAAGQQVAYRRAVLCAAAAGAFAKHRAVAVFDRDVCRFIAG